MARLSKMLGVAACLGLVACASGGKSVETPTAASMDAPVATSAHASESDSLRLTGLQATAADDATIVRLSANQPLAIYSSYVPEPTLVVVDVPNGSYDETLADNLVGDPRIASARLTRLSEFGRPFARLEIRTVAGIEPTVDRDRDGLAIRLAGAAPLAGGNDTLVAATSAEVEIAAGEPEVTNADAAEVASPMTSEPVQVETLASQAPTETVAHVAPAELRPIALPTEPATRLERVVSVVDGGATTIHFEGDGRFAVKDFFLSEPARLVLDLAGVDNSFGKKSLDVVANGVGRVRVSQFQVTPSRITRAVVDLDQRLAYRVEPSPSGFDLVMWQEGQEPPPTSIAAAADVETTPEPATASVIDVASVSAEAVAEEPIVGSEVAAPTPAIVVTEVASSDVTPPAALAVEPEKKPSISKVEEAALYEAAEAFLDESAEPEVAGREFFEGKALGEPTSGYVGEPISLHLKDADLKDVFRTLAQLTGLNIILHPNVGGRVTLDLEQVPWDQALDLILKVNGLSFTLDGNVMRIGTTNDLRREEAEKLALEEARELARPVRTIIQTLSYAQAPVLAGLISQVMTKRGSVIVDPRTNNLIIKDIDKGLTNALDLIKTLDVPNMQVMIEARIVETTKTFSRTLGISWGFLGQADADHGNATNAQFPYNVDVAGGVGLGAPSVGQDKGPLLDFAFGSLLDTFSLDVALSAAEAEGLAKVISAPKVATEDNFAASIESGLQIPIQTVSNNTTTVQYVNATLKLDVTPQITHEGTIIMDINVQKRAPLAGITITGGNNVPISTRDASTRLLVKDGGTAVIGGIYEISDDSAQTRVPWLWKVPILGNLFKNRTISNRHDELLIFITPRIIKN